MSKTAIIGVTDLNYLNHYKSLFGHIRSTGNYKGQIVLIYSGKIDEETYKYLHDRNVNIFNVEAPNNPFFAKYYVFHPYFKQFDKIFYLDADCIVRNDINCIFEDNGEGIYLDQEEFFLWQYLQNNDNDLLNDLKKICDLDKLGFNSSGILYTPNILKGDEVSKLFELSEKYNILNKHCGFGTDQPPLNIFWQNFPISQIKGISFVNRPAQNPLLHTTRYCSPPWTNENYYNKGLEFFEGLK